MDGSDIGVIEGGKDLGFALESCEAIGIGREVRRQRLDGDLPVESGVGGKVHHAPAAAAELAVNLEWTNRGGVHER